MPPKTAKTAQKAAQTGKNLTKCAFLSVFDKTGVEKIARALADHGYTLISTGGTKTHLQDKGLAVMESSEITGFGELLGGRVKSLHPTIFAGILAERKNTDDLPELLIDTVVVNLYPFEKERDESNFKRNADPNHLLHFIDIGGSALIRAAAKNHPDVNVLCDPAQYDSFVEALNNGNGETTLAYRKQLAVEAFRRSVSYDAAISKFLAADDATLLPDRLTLPLIKIQTLRYGENPYQQAALYGNNTTAVDFEYLHGKELSFNNILDMEAAWRIANEFDADETSACAIIKHNNPCGVATSYQSVADAYQTAFDADPLSAFGGVVGFNRPVDKATAEQMKEVFLEVIIAPDFTPEAMALLTQKKNLRLIKRPLTGKRQTLDIKQVNDDLFLVQAAGPEQTVDVFDRLQGDLLKIVSKKSPTEDELRDMVFAWKVVKHVKSNAIVLAKGGKTIGIGSGQTSRIAAVEHALKAACDEAKDAVLASDGFFPAVDNIHAAGLARVAAIIQPGGSIKDEEVIKAANDYGMAMVMTGLREFRH